MSPVAIAFKGLYHPATGQLLQAQTSGMLKRLFAALRSPRKRFLSIVAVVLGCIWLSQAVATLFLRESADPESLKIWLPLGLFAYSFWHFFRLATKPIEAPYAWSPTEQEFVLGAPLTRTQQITYRLLSVASAALAKAFCFSILMLPDLPLWWAGFLGMLLGLTFVDLIRVSAELFVFGLSKRARSWFRSIVVSGALVVFLIALSRCLQSETAGNELASPGALIFFRHLFREVIGLAQSTAGGILLFPFKAFSNVALLDPTQSAWWAGLGSASLMVTAMFGLVYRLDRWMLCRTANQEKAALAQAQVTVTAETEQAISSTCGWVPWRLNGAGGIAWRQLTGAMNYWKSVVVAMVLPIFLSCLPLVSNHDSSTMLIHVVGASLFYSFLLMPSALILDFRRDINRMVVLKALPIRPIFVVLGQLTAPVVICWLFQLSVLLIATLSGKVILWQAGIAWLLVLPVTVFIFAIENFIFLLSPFQRNKEGFDVFLRTILTFTGKCLLFVIGGAILLGLFLVVNVVLKNTSLPPSWISLIGYGVLWSFVSAVAAWFVYRISRQFELFDPSQDVPGIG